MTTPQFNLVDEPWLPVVRTDGSQVEVSLRALFGAPTEIRELVDDSPLVTVALHRLLLAIVHRVTDGPRDDKAWRRLWNDGLPTAQLLAYLDKWRHRFDLFDEERPFFQVGGLQTVDKKGKSTPAAPVTVLCMERASGNNAILFSHDDDDQVRPLSPAQAARALVTSQAFMLGGGKGPRTNVFGEHPYASHATQVGGIIALLQGAELERTLLLNTLVVTEDQPVKIQGADLPIWERATPHTPGKVVPDGYLDYLTLPSRMVRLVPERGPTGEHQVRHIFTAQGCAIDDAADVVSPLWVKRLDKTRGTVPLALREERAIWRDATALFGLYDDEKKFDPRPAALAQSRTRKLSRVIGEDTRLKVRCFGLVNDKAKPVAWRAEDLPATVRLLNDDNLVATVQHANAFAEDAARAVDWGFRVCAETLLTTEQKKPDKNDVSRLAERMGRHAGFWDGMERPFRDLLLALTPERRESLLREWVSLVSQRSTDAYERGARFAQGSVARRLEATVAGGSAVRGRLRKLRAALFPPESPPSPQNGEAHG